MSWRYFRLEEFACKHCGENLMRDPFITKLDELRHRAGFPLAVTSGYRCPTHNDNVSTTGPNGPHTTGRAVDLAVARVRAYEVLRHAFAMRFTGIGVRGHGASRFVHLDDLPDTADLRPTVWTYP